jgi:hypothetical protein
MRKLFVTCAGAVALLTTATFAPPAAQAVTIATPAGLGKAVADNKLTESVGCWGRCGWGPRFGFYRPAFSYGWYRPWYRPAYSYAWYRPAYYRPAYAFYRPVVYRPAFAVYRPVVYRPAFAFYRPIYRRPAAYYAFASARPAFARPFYGPRWGWGGRRGWR